MEHDRKEKNFLLPALALSLFLLLLLSLGCAPQIGDACDHDGNCPTGSICDRTVTDGFCTIRGCRPGECPSESICVAFDRHSTYCMRSCESDEDCRSDHSCIADEETGLNYCFSAD